MKRAFLAIVTLALAACVSAGTKVDERKLSQFQKGTTTYAQVVQVLGTPNAVTLSSDGRRVAVYHYIRSQARAESFIPIVGPLVGGADATLSSVLLTFDQSGILQSYSSTQAQTGSGTGFAAGGGGTTVVTEPQPTLQPAPAQAPASRLKFGASVDSITAPMAKTLQLGPPRGLVVLIVMPGGAAERAGIQPNDVILSYGGTPMNTRDDLQAAVDGEKSGDTASLEIWRQAKEVTVPVNF